MLLDNLSLTTSSESRIQETIRVSFLRHRGNLEKVIKEVKYPREYVVKCLTKFRKACKAEGNRLVADQILNHLLFGYHGRVEHLMQIIEKLESVENIRLSGCHNMPVVPLADLDEEGNTRYECCKCGNEAPTYVKADTEILNQKMAAIALLRQEDAEMVRFSEKLGYTVKDTLPPTTINNTQNILVMNKNGDKMSDSEINDISRLKPIEQEALRQRIEKELSEAEIVENNG